MIVLIAFILTMTMECRGDVTESVIFYPVDKIHTSIRSWIITTAIDFEPYEIMLYKVKEYAKEIKNYLISQIPIFHHKDPIYTHLFNMTLDDINMVQNEISNAKTEASNLIDHVHNNHNSGIKPLLPLGYLFSFLFGTADQSDVDSLKGDVKHLYENQLDETQVLMK